MKKIIRSAFFVAAMVCFGTASRAQLASESPAATVLSQKHTAVQPSTGTAQTASSSAVTELPKMAAVTEKASLSSPTVSISDQGIDNGPAPVQKTIVPAVPMQAEKKPSDQ